MRYQGDALLAHAKAGCYVCLRGDSLVDTDVQIEGEGALVLCKGCLTEAAQVAGLHFNEAAVAEIRQAAQDDARTFDPDAVTALQAQIADLEHQVEIAENTIATLQDAFDRIGPAPSGPAPKRGLKRVDSA